MGKTRDLFKKTGYQGNISYKDGHDKGQKWYGLKRSKAKSKGEKERYTHLNVDFQITRRDKKAFFSDQCKEIEENNRIEKI